MLTFVLEAAMRSLLMALAVWTVIRLLRVQAVLAQKVAWVLVLVAAGAMPLVMHAPWLSLDRAVRIPLRTPSSALNLVRGQATPAQSTPAAGQGSPHSVTFTRSAARSKPAATRPSHSLAGPLLLPEVMHLPLPDVDLVVRTPIFTAPQAPYWTASRIKLWSIFAYLAIGGLLLLRALAGVAIAWRVWRRAVPLNGLFEDGLGDNHLPPVRLRVSKDISTPVTVASTILLPRDYSDWDEAKLRVVLAHEQSHVRQGDFYLQLLAALHVAVFWFSPLGWWLKRKLSELGEALSDRAGLEQAPDPASYAQVLLEFAAMPRRTPYAGVAMARTSNLSSRIERILNDRRFRLAFLGGRRHAILTALLVPATLVAVVACIRIVPAVEAAQAKKAIMATTTVKACTQVANAAMAQVSTAHLIQIANTDFGQVMAAELAQAPAAPAPPALAPVAPQPPDTGVVAPEAPAAPANPDEPQDADTPAAPGDRHHHTHVWVDHNGDDGDSFSIIHENGDGTTRWNGEYNDEIAKARKKLNLHGDYIWFEHDGKSYIVSDPAIVAQANHLFQPNPDLERMQSQLDAKQAELNKRMEEYSPDKVKIKADSPEMKKQMAELNSKLAELQSEKFKKLTTDPNQQISQEVLSDLQEKMGEIQGQIGEIQGQIGEEMGKLGEKQGELGEEMGKVGEEMGRIGEEQGKLAEEAARKMNSVLDQALKSGKARPVD